MRSNLPASLLLCAICAALSNGDQPASSANSLDTRVADATSQFGLDFLRSLPSSRENVLVSPVSMQILLNIILLGTKNQSATQLELMNVLNYAGDHEQNATCTTNATTTTSGGEWPHAAMHSLLENISRATHFTLDEAQQQQQQQLLNSNAQLAAHLQTDTREQPLSGQVNFTLANLMLTNSDLVNTSASYEQDLKRFYDVKLEHFSRASRANSSQAAKLHERVNNWVKNITEGQIGNLVEEADLSDGNLAMVLLNAAHFKGRWLHTFSTKLTQERPFYNEGQELGVKDVMFMRHNGVFGYGEFGSSSDRAAHQQTSALSDETVLTEDPANVTSTAWFANPSSTNGTSEPPAANNSTDSTSTSVTSPPTSTPAAPTTTRAAPSRRSIDEDEEQRQQLTAKLNCAVLMLPFSLNDGQELSMVVFLPNRRDGLAELVGNLSAQALNEVYRSLNEQQVQVELPKFSFESSHNARDALLKMGLAKIFQDGAELDRMFASATATPVKVDKVIHKARIAVDEIGAEAAAASAATIVLRNLIRPPNPAFSADHPFLFIIRHNKSNLPLFMGRIERL